MSDEPKEGFGSKIADILKSGRVWVLIFFIIVSLFSINYQINAQGVIINGVGISSPAENSGMRFDNDLGLTDYERILYLDKHEISTVDEYYNYVNNLDPNSSLAIRTDKNPSGYKIQIEDVGNKTVSDYIGISVRDAAKSNIRLGIDLSGGSRLILEPVDEVTDSDYDLLENTLQSRLDVYGASGTKVSKIEDTFSGEKFLMVESSHSNKNDILQLIEKEGVFIAQIGNQTVFTGENVARVFNDPSHQLFEGCSGDENSGYICTFSFTFQIDPTGANNFFDVSSTLGVAGGYLTEKLYFYLDGEEITELNIDSSFKYSKITNPSITISGNVMQTQELAIESAKKEMRFLQAILSTQNLPSELEVVASYSITSSTGQKLLDNAIIVGLLSLLIVSGVIALRYRNISVFIGIFIALAGEIIIVFGIAAFMKLSIDLAAIGGLIAAIGTGVDDQVIITDEYFRGKNSKLTSRKKIKHAITIIMLAYFTTLAAMVPLYFAGLKVLQGFAFMIIIGVTVGVLITRPMYAEYLRLIMTTRTQRKEEAELDD